MILLIIDYCNFYLTPCTDKSKTKLKRMQNRALLICLKADNLTSNSDLHSQVNLAPLGCLRKFNILKLFHGKVHSGINSSLDITISLPDDIQTPLTPFTRSHEAPLIHSPRPTSEKYSKSLLYIGIKLWNNSSNDMRNNLDYNSFKFAQQQIYLPYLPSPTSDM